MQVARIALTAAVMLMAASSLADAGTGAVHISFAKGGIFLGAGKGSGTLYFHGQSYALDVSGFSIGTIGFGVTKLKGHAHNLRHAADIVGTYTAASVSMAVAAGGKVARLQNANGVVYLQLEGPEVGLELSAALAGLTISLGSH